MPNFEILIEKEFKDKTQSAFLSVGIVPQIGTALLIATYIREFALAESEFIILRTTNENCSTASPSDLLENFEKKQ